MPEPEVVEIKIAIFEDNKLIREALQTIINGTPGFICTGTFPNANQIEADIRFSRPDVVLMDIEMPGVSGIECVKIVKEVSPNTNTFMLTVFEDEHNIFESIKAGAIGYLLKKDPPDSILNAIRKVYSGEAIMNGKIARKVLEFYRQKEQTKKHP